MGERQGLEIRTRDARATKRMMNWQLLTDSWRSLTQTKPVRLLIETAKEWYEDRTVELGAALAYYAVFSISPIVLMAIAVASMFLGQDAAEGRITQQIENAVGPTVANAIQGTLAYTYRSGSGTWTSILGIAILFIAAMGFFGQLQSALNTIWEVKPKPGRGLWGTLRDRFLSFLAVLAACSLLLASLLASGRVLRLGRHLAALGDPRSPSPLADLDFPGLLRLPHAGVCATVSIPARRQDHLAGRVDRRGGQQGLFIFGNYLISLYLRWSGTTSAYGAAGSFVVILLWGYYSSQILLLGARVYSGLCPQ